MATLQAFFKEYDDENFITSELFHFHIRAPQS